MTKTKIEFRFDLLIIATKESKTKKFLTDLRDDTLNHIEKLEKEIKVQQDIMDQQVNLIMEKEEEK